MRHIKETTPIMSNKTLMPIGFTFDPSRLNVTDLPEVGLHDRCNLPPIPGIYFAIDSAGVIRYVGQSGNIKRRWANHGRLAQLVAECEDVVLRFFEVRDSKLRLFVEAACISHFVPTMNNSTPNVAYPSVSIYIPGNYLGIPIITPQRIKELIVNGDGTPSEFRNILSCNGASSDMFTHKTFSYFLKSVGSDTLCHLYALTNGHTSFEGYARFIESCKWFLRADVLSGGTANDEQRANFAMQKLRFHPSTIKEVKYLIEEELDWLKLNGLMVPEFDVDECDMSDDDASHEECWLGSTDFD